MIQRLGIVGVGLLGASVGLAARRAGLARTIVGYDTNVEHLAIAQLRNAIDFPVTSLAGFADAELVVLAMPVDAIRNAANAIAETTHCAITDVGSVKRPIAQSFGATLACRRFVGAHPMAGSEHSGPQSARADLFEKSVCAIIATADTDMACAAQVERFWSAVGCRILHMTAEQHDWAAAYTSHMPHLASVAVALAATRDVTGLFGSGLLDATRLAESGSAIWRPIVEQNGAAIVEALDAVIVECSRLRDAIVGGDGKTIAELLDLAASRRAQIVSSRNR